MDVIALCVLALGLATAALGMILSGLSSLLDSDKLSAVGLAIIAFGAALTTVVGSIAIALKLFVIV